jgi:hypothetical protein
VCTAPPRVGADEHAHAYAQLVDALHNKRWYADLRPFDADLMHFGSADGEPEPRILPACYRPVSP